MAESKPRGKSTGELYLRNSLCVCVCVFGGREGVAYSGCLDMIVPWWLISLGRNALWRQRAFYSCRDTPAEIHREGEIDREQSKKNWGYFSISQPVNTTDLQSSCNMNRESLLVWTPVIVMYLWLYAEMSAWLTLFTNLI